MITNPNYTDTFYDPLTGTFWRQEKITRNIRQVPLDDLRRITVASAITGKYTHKGAGQLAWEFISGSPVPEVYVIYFKNLDNEDFTAGNIGIISKVDFKKVKDAMYNLQGSLKIIPDTREVYTYKVKYKEGGVNKIKCFQDCIAAKKFHKEVLLRSVRELGKYAITQ